MLEINFFHFGGIILNLSILVIQHSRGIFDSLTDGFHLTDIVFGLLIIICAFRVLFKMISITAVDDSHLELLTVESNLCFTLALNYLVNGIDCETILGTELLQPIYTSIIY